jgi:hypothetical protein
LIGIFYSFSPQGTKENSEYIKYQNLPNEDNFDNFANKLFSQID